MANPVATNEAIVIVVDAAHQAAGHIDADAPAIAQAADDEAGPDPWKVQADLEDQTLPVPVATLPLDWQPFPHLYPNVNGGTSAFIDLLRPPPVA